MEWLYAIAALLAAVLPILKLMAKKKDPGAAMPADHMDSYRKALVNEDKDGVTAVHDDTSRRLLQLRQRLSRWRAKNRTGKQ